MFHKNERVLGYINGDLFWADRIDITREQDIEHIHTASNSVNSGQQIVTSEELTITLDLVPDSESSEKNDNVAELFDDIVSNETQWIFWLNTCIVFVTDARVYEMERELRTVRLSLPKFDVTVVRT